MPAKRKSDVLEAEKGNSSLPQGNANAGPSAKARKVEKISDIVLDGEEEGEVEIYDDCNDIRRKIRALEKTPGFKITHWLKELGNINSNSYRQFMKMTRPNGGAGNRLYYSAYVYFEKKRILEGKKKTPKRIQNEEGQLSGFEQQRTRNHIWVLG
ncbi:hypothetical protein FRB93_000077 [Tulasnella sp. JGI-2019a]|nr:hypothetical protein FRB93_000077 [Tulasnella sp. JGI-2019a]